MPGIKRRTPLDPENLRLACELSQLAYWLRPMKHVPGKRKACPIELGLGLARRTVALLIGKSLEPYPLG